MGSSIARPFGVKYVYTSVQSDIVKLQRVSFSLSGPP
jgi:hypothetical protein